MSSYVYDNSGNKIGEIRPAPDYGSRDGSGGGSTPSRPMSVQGALLLFGFSGALLYGGWRLGGYGWDGLNDYASDVPGIVAFAAGLGGLAMLLGSIICLISVAVWAGHKSVIGGLLGFILVIAALGFVAFQIQSGAEVTSQARAFYRGDRFEATYGSLGIAIYQQPSVFAPNHDVTKGDRWVITGYPIKSDRGAFWPVRIESTGEQGYMSYWTLHTTTVSKLGSR